jgi:hypothetical protein
MGFGMELEEGGEAWRAYIATAMALGNHFIESWNRVGKTVCFS